MPRSPEQGDDGIDLGSDQDGFGSFEDSDIPDHRDLLDDLPEDDGASDGPGRGSHAGEGLTEPERELADELNRRRELEATRDRFERSAGISELGSGGRGQTAIERDAVAVIDAAERFGVDADDSEPAEKERASIAEALALNEERKLNTQSEYNFYAIIAGHSTKGTNLIVTMKVPWEHRDEVFKAMDTMPFAAMVKMTEIDMMDG